jgi:hypothetical protein
MRTSLRAEAREERWREIDIMTATLSKLLILIYGVSIAGYVLLDGSHALMHVLKSELHHHKIDHHSHGHHHVEDHQHIFTPDTDEPTESKDSIKIFSFLLFYQTPADYSVFNVVGNLEVNGLSKKILTVTRAPLTPPPLS